MLAQVKLDDVFKSTQKSIEGDVSGQKLLALFFAVFGLILVLALLQYRRKQVSETKTLNHHGKLMREALRKLPLKSAQARQLKQLAESQSISSPLVLLLCPSVMQKAIEERHGQQEKKGLA